MSNETFFDDPQMVESFLMEADEIFERLDDDLVTLETRPEDLELLDAIFRGVHTLKGMAGFLGFTELVQLAHETESVLDRLRKLELTATPVLIDVILKAVDLIKHLLDDIRSHDIQSRDLSEISTKLANLLTSQHGSGHQAELSSVMAYDIDPTEDSEETEEEPEISSSTLEWLRNQQESQPGNPIGSQQATKTTSDTLQRLHQQESSGIDPNVIEYREPPTDSQEPLLFAIEHPPALNVTAKAVSESLGIHEQTTRAVSSGREPLEQPNEIDTISITEITSDDFADFVPFNIESRDRIQGRVDDLLKQKLSAEAQETSKIDIDVATVDEISDAEMSDNDTDGMYRAQQENNQIRQSNQVVGNDDPLGKPDVPIDVETQTAKEIPSESPLPPIVPGRLTVSAIKQEPGSATLRVDVKRLEEMMNLIGELVLERNRLLKLNRDFEQKINLSTFEDELSENAVRLNRLTTDLQRSILSIRMLPIGNVFRKFPRIVRDTARETRKEVRLTLSGEETELDKTIVDVIGEPLVHLIRNSIDHGIETPEAREASGKPRQGNVWLSASHVGNQIIIEIADDGKGIDTRLIGQKAIEKGIVTQAQLPEMSHKEILNLIFLPGFSTASQVSELSGRGVGMDVVRTTVRNFNGTIEMESQPGKGSRISLKLPLTLAIIQALIVKVGQETFAVPLSSIIETVRIMPGDIQMIQKREVLDLRNRVLPLVRLREILKCDSLNTSPMAGKREVSYVLVLGIAEHQLGVIVDRLVGEEEIVVKSLGNYLGNVPGIAGATIMGDGQPALILEVAAFMGIYGEANA